jgi:nitrite reductase/ring-hydroxylating ferredoxin subunit/DMSO/TMAO reductase YedYZ heme-binding membrane subunit
MISGLVAAIGAFAVVSLVTHPGITIETLIIRGTAIGSVLLLHVILCIGPLARLKPAYLPWLYNRRHLGVTMFLLALIHAVFVLVQFHAAGSVNPLVSVFTAYAVDYRPWNTGGTVAAFPFEPFGFVALVILFLMAATSHDFWLRNLDAPFWKALHMGVYIAYGALIAHVAYGVLQSETSPVYAGALSGGALCVLGLHILAGYKEARTDQGRPDPIDEGFMHACFVADLREGHGKAVMVGSERKALFRHQSRIYALSNVCRHQGGPIGEGRILDGCITCPWHGWQYLTDTGTSPPPFHEVIETYPVRVVDGVIYVNPEPNPLESKTEGAPIGAAE